MTAVLVVIHLLEGYVVAPRVLAKAVGLHPAISIIALLVGAQLLGVWGALFAAPLVGLLQVLFTAMWVGWRHDHPNQFADDVDKPALSPAALAPVTSATPVTLSMPAGTADILTPATEHPVA